MGVFVTTLMADIAFQIGDAENLTHDFNLITIIGCKLEDMDMGNNIYYTLFTTLGSTFVFNVYSTYVYGDHHLLKAFVLHKSLLIFLQLQILSKSSLS